jgi:hypothetical protein
MEIDIRTLRKFLTTAQQTREDQLLLVLQRKLFFIKTYLQQIKQQMNARNLFIDLQHFQDCQDSIPKKALARFQNRLP